MAGGAAADFQTLVAMRPAPLPPSAAGEAATVPGMERGRAGEVADRMRGPMIGE
jgi:hypothetical protein